MGHKGTPKEQMNENENVDLWFCMLSPEFSSEFYTCLSGVWMIFVSYLWF